MQHYVEVLTTFVRETANFKKINIDENTISGKAHEYTGPLFLFTKEKFQIILYKLRKTSVCARQSLSRVYSVEILMPVKVYVVKLSTRSISVVAKIQLFTFFLCILFKSFCLFNVIPKHFRVATSPHAANTRYDLIDN